MLSSDLHWHLHLLCAYTTPQLKMQINRKLTFIEAYITSHGKSKTYLTLELDGVFSTFFSTKIKK